MYEIEDVLVEKNFLRVSKSVVLNLMKVKARRIQKRYAIYHEQMDKLVEKIKDKWKDVLSVFISLIPISLNEIRVQPFSPRYHDILMTENRTKLS